MYCGLMRVVLNSMPLKKKVYVRINKNYRKKIAPVGQRVRHGSGSVMFWGSVSYNGAGDLVHIDGSMSQIRYLDTLSNYAFPSGDRLIEKEFIFLAIMPK